MLKFYRITSMIVFRINTRNILRRKPFASNLADSSLAPEATYV
jgi:hypothetical protein